MNELWFLVLAMGLVTYLPRLVPLVLFQNIPFTPFIRRFLQFIPFAALGSLIFPGVIHSTGDPSSAIAGTLIAVGLAWFRANIILVVMGAIAGVYFSGLL
jgi:branched-subunit amino acid transport protein